jgi:hypothetical protein
MYSGQDELSFLDGTQAILDAEMHVVDEMIELHPKLPQVRQMSLFPVGRRRGTRNQPGVMARNDEADQQAAKARSEALRASVTWSAQVGTTMAIDANPAQTLRKLERATGMDSRPSRRFHYMKQADFFVEEDGERVEFPSQVVRANVAVSEPVQVQATLVPSRSRSTIVRARVDVCDDTGREDGLASGGEREFRLLGLDWWQKAVLEGGRGLMLPVDMTALETMSTCSLQLQPAEVRELKGWLPLLECVTDALTRKVRELRQAAGDTIDREPLNAGEANVDPMVETL